MDAESSIRIAATAAEGVSAEQAGDIIRAFVRLFSGCFACSGTGTMTIANDTAVTYSAESNYGKLRRGDVLEPCPVCRARPQWMRWHCESGMSKHGCEKSEHEKEHCGPAAMIPFREIGLE